MSELPAESLTYQTLIAEYFLALRGSSLMLSPLDVEQVQAWERRGIPAEIVCRGLQRGFQSYLDLGKDGHDRPRSVRAVAASVEDEWRASRSSRVGLGERPVSEREAVVARLSVAILLTKDARSWAPPALQPSYSAALRSLTHLRENPPDQRELESLLRIFDRELVKFWLRSLPPSVRGALGDRCSAAAGESPPRISPRAYRASLQAHLLDAAREAGLLILKQSV